MDPDSHEMTRISSNSSSVHSTSAAASIAEQDGASDLITASTPPTSVNDSGTPGSTNAITEVTDEEPARRSKRQRTITSSYSLRNAEDTQTRPTLARGSTRDASRKTASKTATDQPSELTPVRKRPRKASVAMSEPLDDTRRRRSPRQLQMQQTVKDRMKKVAGRVGSVLGKRGREVMEAGKKKLGIKDVAESPKQARALRQLDMGKGGVLDEMDLDADFSYQPPRPVKRQKTTIKAAPAAMPETALQKTSDDKKVKKWQKEGLYVGQVLGADATKHAGKTKMQQDLAGASASDGLRTGKVTTGRQPFMPLPMFNYLDKTRDFTIPFDVFAPSAKRGDEKPKDWTKLNRNRPVGDAKELWEKAEKLATSACVCQLPPTGELGCGEDCLNRVMQYECNDDNCSLARGDCSNRAFADLSARTKKGGAYDVGVEVVKTQNRGFGVRSCRAFAPGQIIMEYTGEVISEGECQRRMRQEYMDKQCYYLMELERGLIIDGTKGSMARFINHSCAPNCEVRMMKVNGIPRMGVFAGDDGVTTGEELTYDYNFDNFGTTQQICYCGAPTCRGFLSKRLNAVEQKKFEKEEAEKRRKAAEDALKRAQADEKKKKQAQDNRAPGWKGWIAVDDPVVKEALRAEKKAKEEASKTTDRALRMAARRSSLPARVPAAKPMSKKKAPPRRKTLPAKEEASHDSSDEEPIDSNLPSTKRDISKTLPAKDEVAHDSSDEDGDEAMEDAAPPPKSTKTEVTHLRTTSTGSKFTEQLSSPAVAPISQTVIQHTEVSITTISKFPDDQVQNEAHEAEFPLTKSIGQGLSRTASMGKGVINSIGQAVRNSLKTNAAPASSSLPGEQLKLKQSKLNFTRIS